MSAWRRHRVELFWAGLLLAVVVAALVPPPARPQTLKDTWSAEPGGKKVFFTLAQRLLGDVKRQSDSLVPNGPGTLCILGPARYPDASEWRRLRDWVAAGNTLIFAATPEDPTVELLYFGLRVRPEPPRERAAPEDAGVGLQVDEELAGKVPRLAWEADAWVHGARASAWIVARAQGHPVAVVQQEGAGWIAAVSSDALFENASVAHMEHAMVAFRMMERVRAPGPVRFDESLNASGRPRVFGLLFAPAFRPLTLQLLAIAVLFGWLGARRFGPVVVEEPASRRFMTEHARAFGALAYKAHAGARLVASYLEYFRREAGLTQRRRDGKAALEILARRTRTEAATVVRAVRLADDVATSGRATNSQASTAVAGLAQIKHNLGPST